MNEKMKECFDIDICVKTFLNNVSRRLKAEGRVDTKDVHIEYCGKRSSKQMNKTKVKARKI